MKYIRGIMMSALVNAATQLGLEIHFEPKYRAVGFVRKIGQRPLYFRRASFDINTQAASEMVNDKGQAYYFMKMMGYSIPEGSAFYSDALCRRIGSPNGPSAVREYAAQLGYPVFIKPNSHCQGRGAEEVMSMRQLEIAMTYIFDDLRDPILHIQRVASGNEYRLVILSDELILAYQKKPLSIVGDGKKTIRDLILDKQEQLRLSGRNVKIDVRDRLIKNMLSQEGFTETHVVEPGKQIFLLSNSNLATGGSAFDVTDRVHSSYVRLAVNLTRDMGLRFSGIDLMTCNSIEDPISDYVIIEINASPGLKTYNGTLEQQKIELQGIYIKILRALTED